MKKSTPLFNKDLLALFIGISAGFMFLTALFTTFVRDFSDDDILVLVFVVVTLLSVLNLLFFSQNNCSDKVSPNPKRHE